MRGARLLLLLRLGLPACTNKQECETCSSDDDGSRRCGQGTGSTFCPMR